MLRLPAALPFLMLIAAGTVARAATPMAWETTVDPGCHVRAAQFAREVDLACDAAGMTCKRVERGGAAQARLACRDASAWTVEARDPSGAHLWTIAIEGAPESRVRVAAMWLARAPRDAPPPDAKVIALAPVSQDARTAEAATSGDAPLLQALPAPQPETAATPPTSSDLERPGAPADEGVLPPKTAPKDAPTAPIASAHPAIANVDTTDHDSANDAATTRARGGIAASFGAAASAGVATPSLGGGARAVFALPVRLNAGVALAATRSLGNATAYSLTAFRAGAALGWGAPWSDGIFGASIDAGALAGSVATASSVSPASRGFVVPYGAFAVIAAVPTRRAFRPWVSLSLMAMTRAIQVTESGQAVAPSAQASAGIDVGVAWAAW